VGVQITGRLGDDGTTVYYDTEMTQLSVAGGGLPLNVQIRESPTKASLGRTTSIAVSVGPAGYQLDSFFDIFTEVSTDSGMSWLPSVAGLATVTLEPQLVVITPVIITSLSGTTLAYGAGGGGRFVLLQSSSLTAPRSGWSRVATNSTTPGAFTIPAVGSASGPLFYSIKSE
jgi:hypothetical protein